MDIFERMKREGYEQIIFNFDKETGMKAMIAIHDSTLGQTFGGVKMAKMLRWRTPFKMPFLLVSLKLQT